jgi:hypothetical protein
VVTDACGNQATNTLVYTWSAATTAPVITRIRLSGTTLTFSATNGSAGGTYYLLMSTNAALPMSQWTPVLTNTFDDAGDAYLPTQIVNPGDPQEFYIIVVPQ